MTTQPTIYRCLWCKDRIGHPSFYNQRGETVIVPEWAMPKEGQFDDGICPLCSIEANEKLAEARR